MSTAGKATLPPWQRGRAAARGGGGGRGGRGGNGNGNARGGGDGGSGGGGASASSASAGGSGSSSSSSSAGRGGTGGGAWRRGLARAGGVGGGSNYNSSGHGGRPPPSLSHHYQHHHHHHPPPAFTVDSTAGAGTPSAAHLANFVKDLARVPDRKLREFLAVRRALWVAAWRNDARASRSVEAMGVLVDALARVPFSAEEPVDAVPLSDISESIQDFLGHCRALSEEQAVKNVEASIRAAKRLLGHSWNLSKADVKDHLESTVAGAATVLNLKNKEHRLANGRITEFIEELEKPWTIKIRAASTNQDTELVPFTSESQEVAQAAPSGVHLAWRSATVDWLSMTATFQASKLPVMQGPKSASRGVYTSPEDYFDTVLKLWVAITFEHGNNALTPHCRTRDKDKECGHVLWPIPDDHASTLQCQVPHCTRRVVLACPNRFHNRGLCAHCANRARQLLCGPPSPHASTHIYDARVTRVSFDGRVSCNELRSRRPPITAPNWKTTKRLCAPSLVGVVPLSAAGASLRPSDAIMWGEIVAHEPQDSRQEFKYRERGQVAFSVFDLSDVSRVTKKTQLDLKMRDRVAIIDCQTFVPEFIPVLIALEHQRLSPVPFQNGALLNLSPRADATPCEPVEPPPGAFQDLDSDAESDVEDEIATPLAVANSHLDPRIVRENVSALLDESMLEPVIQLRRDPSVRKKLQSNLESLIQHTTLDPGQMSSFLDSLKHPVHCTLGPPGTGKSYVGVVMVRALLIIRRLWIQTNPSVGQPPLLALSYKNHAIDEFLLDLVRSEPQVRLIRIGGGSTEPALKPYVERSAVHDSPLVRAARRRLETLHEARVEVRSYPDKLQALLAARGDAGPQPADGEVLDDHEQKRRKQSAYDAAVLLKGLIARAAAFGADVIAEEKLSSLKDLLLPSHWATLKYDSFEKHIALASKDQLVIDYETISKLYDGIKHYDPKMDVCEILWKFLNGIGIYLTVCFTPLPPCTYVGPTDDMFHSDIDDHVEQTYNDSSVFGKCTAPTDPGSNYCSAHRCQYWTQEDGMQCVDSIVPGKVLCSSHACEAPGCPYQRSPGQIFCEIHACIICVSLGIPAQMAQEDVPRNTCGDHRLCVASPGYCENLAVANSLYCSLHMRVPCEATTSRERKCPGWGTATDPFCSNHSNKSMSRHNNASAWPVGGSSYKPQPVALEIDPAVETEGAKTVLTEKRQCRAESKKQCKSTALDGSMFCRDHQDYVPAPANATPAFAPTAALPSILPTITGQDHQNHVPAPAPVIPTPASAPSAALPSVLTATAAPLLERTGPTEPSKGERNPAGGITGMQSALQDHAIPEIYDVDVDDDDAFVLLDLVEESVRPPFDNPDELDFETEHLEHLREVFGTDADVAISSSLNEDEFEDQSNSASVDDSTAEAQTAVTDELIDPADWAWCMPLDTRWNTIEAFVAFGLQIHARLLDVIAGAFDAARLQLLDAEVRAKAQVYEGKEVLGGTIVSCIGRLEVIRALNPFAVLVEEASEVLEPLLFSCLSKSTCKFEQIGDHLQLAPSLMSKFDFERINKINVSMFERLICAPGSNTVPYSVLSIQRRMRKSICDLTRGFYENITVIEDHEICHTKRIGDKLPKSVPTSRIDLLRNTTYSGREVPGLGPSSFFWVHGGAQTRADVGLSKVNKAEAEMVCLLAKYLCDCGVPKQSIAILTPYKGQLMLIRRRLQELRLLPFKKDDNVRFPDSVVCSTVDRFQGDEADVVIGSIVADEKSTTPFVKLQNRMIVLLSRARVGMVLVGNTGYFDNDSAKGVEHWKRALQMLQKPCDADSTDTAIVPFTGIRSGKELPLCCPLHRDVRKMARTAQDTINEALLMWRCPQNVKVQMPCSHTIQVTCAEETDLSMQETSWPLCQEPALRPYMYPCGHELQLVCSTLANWEANPSLAKQCKKTVTYTPPCSHARQVACYLQTQYVDGSAAFVCNQRVLLSLPRCGHQAKVPCTKKTAVLAWKGVSLYSDGIVREGVSYGPKDFACDKDVVFSRACGHQTNMACGTAFDLAVSVGHCGEKELILNPECGHPLSTTCHQKRALEANGALASIPRPVIVVHEGDASVFGPPCGVAIARCTEMVLLRRKCSHEEKKTCVSARAPGECNAKRTMPHPICQHPITLPCYLSDLKGWKPWPETFTNSDSWKVLQMGIFEDNWTARPQAIPPSLKHVLSNCKVTVEFRRASTCGHSISLPCNQAVKLLQNAGGNEVPLPPCKVAVVGQLLCGHEQTFECRNIAEAVKRATCKKLTARQCWNFEICGQTLQQPCNSTDLPKWLRVHPLGVPDCCPGCESDKLQDAIMETAEGQLEFQCDLPSELTMLDRSKYSALELELDHQQFGQMYTDLLSRFQSWRESIPEIWLRPLYRPRAVRWFLVVQATQREANFDVTRWSRSSTLNGVQERNTGGDLPSRGLRSCCYVLVDPDDVPRVTQPAKSGNGSGGGNNPFVQEQRNMHLKLVGWTDTQRARGYDSVHQHNRNGTESLTVWEPYALYATHSLRLPREVFESIPEQFSLDDPPNDFGPIIIQGTFGVGQSVAKENVPSIQNPEALKRFSSTRVSSLRFSASWDGRLLPDGAHIDPSVEGTLGSKLQFANGGKSASGDPFAGLEYLGTLSSAVEIPEMNLFRCLELLKLNDYVAEAEQLFQEYADSVLSSAAAAHPLSFLAASRLASMSNLEGESRDCLAVFAEVYPDHAGRWMTPEEAAAVDGSRSTADAASLPKMDSRRGDVTPSEMWDQLKSKEGCASPAMEKLLALTGLRKVKSAAVKIFNSALTLEKMDATTRKKNAMTLNFCFSGNPGLLLSIQRESLTLFQGTGKTTVARLFAQILKDCGARRSSQFADTTAQKLKDDGADEFRKLIASSTNGTLFIDEAYDLDPAGDFKGKPIASELLTASENLRESVSIILAGYEDDIRKKLYEYNNGLKSRFEEIPFEDFDQDELETIWKSQLDEKGWTADPLISGIVARDLIKGAKRKGFGNARAVRSLIERATKAAMAENDFDPQNMELRPVHVIGEDPSINPKVQRIVKMFEEMTGWEAVKQAVRELVTVCAENYQLKLAGKAESPVQLNRLFLGNPGIFRTGKTTCAKMYATLLKELNFLSVGGVVEKTASNFIGSHIGESQKSASSIIEGARGKVLLIDEAYSLSDGLYGNQVLDVIVEKVQGTPSDDIAVLLLGYEKKMSEMLRKANPGLARRFAFDYAFRFEDYTDAQLLLIFNRKCRSQNLRFTSEVSKKALRVLSMQRAQANFGNAGAVDNLLKSALAKASARMSGTGESATEITLVAEDIEGIDLDGSEDPLKLLDGLYMVDEIKRKLVELRNGIKVAKREGSRVPDIGHFVFRLGVLPTNRLKETTGLGLTGEFLGHTKKAVENQLGEARGGILFVDEVREMFIKSFPDISHALVFQAYALCNDHFGSEAITSLVAAMTDPQYQHTVIIFAGYSREMDEMLDLNVGIKSRINHYLDFRDWSPDACAQCIFDNASKDNLALSSEQGVLDIVRDTCARLQRFPGWANGRDVVAFWKLACSRRATRIVDEPEVKRALTEDDFKLAAAEILKGREPPVEAAEMPPRRRFTSEHLAHFSSLRTS
ncbi:hypothetical protein DFJ73DRAFT_769718 [Zopfochytrium polystomum]|nr:hypothetical protein DFJ73DRAFT_769718 [Zopfochytrium polystomum]